MVKSVAEMFKDKDFNEVMEDLKKESRKKFGDNYVEGHTHKALPHNGVLHIFDNPAGIPYVAVWHNGIEVGSTEYANGEGEVNIIDWWENHYTDFAGEN